MKSFGKKKIWNSEQYFFLDYKTRKLAKWRFTCFRVCLNLKMSIFARSNQPTSLLRSYPTSMKSVDKTIQNMVSPKLHVLYNTWKSINRILLTLGLVWTWKNACLPVRTNCLHSTGHNGRPLKISPKKSEISDY